MRLESRYAIASPSKEVRTKGALPGRECKSYPTTACFQCEIGRMLICGALKYKRGPIVLINYPLEESPSDFAVTEEEDHTC